MAGCWDVGDLVQRKIDEGKEWVANVENEWHLNVLETVRAISPTPALEYLFEEVRVLAGTEITDAIGDLDTLRSLLLPDILPFRPLGLGDDYRRFSDEEVFERARQIEARRSVSDSEYRTGSEAFFSFLVSQREVLAEAVAAKSKALHVQFHG